MRRVALALTLAVLTAGGFVLAGVMRTSGSLTQVELAPVQDLVPMREALLWRDRAQTEAPEWSDREVVIARGYVSLRDDLVSSWNHLIDWDAIRDDRILDPTQPEALLYRRDEQGEWALHAFVFFLPEKYTYANTPNIADGTGVWHLHPRLCLTGDPFEDEALGTIEASCDQGVPLPNVLMLHAWVQPNSCGPFAPSLIRPEEAQGLPLDTLNSLFGGADSDGEIPGCDRKSALAVWPELAK